MFYLVSVGYSLTQLIFFAALKVGPEATTNHLHRIPLFQCSDGIPNVMQNVPALNKIAAPSSRMHRGLDQQFDILSPARPLQNRASSFLPRTITQWNALTKDAVKAKTGDIFASLASHLFTFLLLIINKLIVGINDRKKSLVHDSNVRYCRR